jgi:hypothetical protein
VCADGGGGRIKPRLCPLSPVDAPKRIERRGEMCGHAPRVPVGRGPSGASRLCPFRRHLEPELTPSPLPPSPSLSRKTQTDGSVPHATPPPRLAPGQRQASRSHSQASSARCCLVAGHDRARATTPRQGRSALCIPTGHTFLSPHARSTSFPTPPLPFPSLPFPSLSLPLSHDLLKKLTACPLSSPRAGSVSACSGPRG